MAPIYWQAGKTHLECSRYMLDNEVNCDICFKVGEDQECIKAHKYTLRMFNSSFCEADSDPVIPDVTAAAFKIMLRYCYYECLNMGYDVALSVLYASTKYMLPLLEEAARKKLIENLSGSNIWETYTYALNVGDTTLLEGCHKFFKGDISPVREALQTEAFLTIPHKVLLDLLHINDEVDNASSHKGEPIDDFDSQIYYNNCGISISEVGVFKACHLWATKECQRQEIDPTDASKTLVLGECLSLIRLNSMLSDDLLNVVHPTGLLHQSVNDNSKTNLQRQFVITTPNPPTPPGPRGTLYVGSRVRVMLSRLWIRGTGPGTYRVTVRDETSEESWSMKYDTKLEGHCSHKIGGKNIWLHAIDIKPQLLQACTKYSVTAERIKDMDHPDYDLIQTLIVISELSPYKEVEVTRDSEKQGCVHALKLALI